MIPLLLIPTLAALAVADPQGYGYSAPAPSNIYTAPHSNEDSAEVIPILRDDRVHGEDGTYNLDLETGNGIVLSQSGDSDGDKQGVISFTHPDGSEFYMTYVADENGFQPQSEALPVAPAFPHPIPEFVLKQIEFARQEDEAAAREAEKSANSPSSLYSAPKSKEEYRRNKRDAPAYTYAAPQNADTDISAEVIPVLRDERAQFQDGTYNFDIETANGITLSQSGDSDGDKQGVISFTHPDGSEFFMTFVADENGFQPQSDALPVAPAFPHPIPEFVLEQIEFARLEEEAAAREAKSPISTPNSLYSGPESSEEQ